jgi:hypothetical protein
MENLRQSPRIHLSPLQIFLDRPSYRLKECIQMQPPSRLIGNRLALAGTVLYFLEWVAIAFLRGGGELSLARQGAGVVVDSYRGHARPILFAAGWFAFVLLGRVLFMAALRTALRDSGRDSLLADFAVAAMTISVTIEIASFGATAAAGWLADAEGDAPAIVALHGVGSLLFLIVFVPIMVSVLGASAGMFRSGLFSRWLPGLGLVVGAVGSVGGIIQVAAAGELGTTLGGAGATLTNAGVLGFWIWMIATSIILWRHAGQAVEAT